MVGDTITWFILTEIWTLLLLQNRLTLPHWGTAVLPVQDCSYNNLSLVNSLVSFILHHLVWAMCPNAPLAWEALLFSYIIKYHPQIPADLWFVKFFAKAANGSYLKTVLFVRFFWKSKDLCQNKVIWDLADTHIHWVKRLDLVLKVFTHSRGN